jgi:hypothetical protein
MATRPVDTVNADGSTAYQAAPTFVTLPSGRVTTSDNGRNAPLTLVVSASIRPLSMATSACGSRYRSASV